MPILNKNHVILSNAKNLLFVITEKVLKSGFFALLRMT